MDLVLALWAYSSHRQHPPYPQPDQSERSTSSPHSGRPLALTFQSPPAWCKAVGSGNILVTSPGEIYSIYSPGRLGLNKRIIKSRIVVHLSINLSGKLKTSPECLRDRLAVSSAGTLMEKGFRLSPVSA
jgi:hypothetical protein